MSKLDKLETLLPMHLIEQAAQQQIYDVLDLDFLLRLVIMPDVHMGYHLPIGGVALLDGYVSPSFVGYDIGCGMCMIRLGLTVAELFGTGSKGEKRKQEVYDAIYEKIPVGVNVNRAEQVDYPAFRSALGSKELDNKVNAKLRVQLGTLGSGNHFIEVGRSEANDEVCVTIHSGSRRPGWEVGGHYMKMNQFFPADSDEGKAYWEDMTFMLEFALQNRAYMMDEMLKILGFNQAERGDLFANMINENHNHAVQHADGLLHRKGATPAEVGQKGVIPIQMGRGVYVTTGLGNEKYLSSASHGAGRKMSRGKAKRTLDLAEFENRMKGILAPVCKGTLDEAPMAYKDEDTVIDAQKGIVVDIDDAVRPLMVAKGGKNDR